MTRIRATRQRLPVVEALEGRALLSAGGGGAAGRYSPRFAGRPGVAAQRASGMGGGAQVYQVTLAPENGSGVSGRATIVQRGDRARVTLVVSGLEPGTIHASHVHGFAGQPQDRPSEVPPPSAADDDPTPNGLGPDITSETESTPFVGHIIRTLSRSFRANARGVGRFQAMVDLRHQDYPVNILPLTIRMVEVHGMTVDGVYQPTVPVAGGMPMPG